VSLQKNLLLTGKEDVVIEQISKLIGARVLRETPFVVGQELSLVGYSSHLGMEWGFEKWSEVAVSNIVVGSIEG